MTKAETIEKFEKIKRYYGNAVSLGELRTYIERNFPKKNRVSNFDRTLTNYISDIYKLNKWNLKCQSNQKD